MYGVRFLKPKSRKPHHVDRIVQKSQIMHTQTSAFHRTKTEHHSFSFISILTLLFPTTPCIHYKMKMNETSTLLTTETVSSCYQEANWVLATSLLLETTQEELPATAILEVPFAPWMLVILCFIACILINLVSQPEQGRFLNGFDDSVASCTADADADTDTSLQEERPLLHRIHSDDSSQSSLTMRSRDESAHHFRNTTRYNAKLRNFIRNKIMRQRHLKTTMHHTSEADDYNAKKDKPKEESSQSLRSNVPVLHSPRLLSSPRKMIIDVNHNHHHHHHMTAARQPVYSRLEQKHARKRPLRQTINSVFHRPQQQEQEQHQKEPLQREQQQMQQHHHHHHHHQQQQHHSKTAAGQLLVAALSLARITGRTNSSVQQHHHDFYKQGGHRHNHSEDGSIRTLCNQ